jgi:uncharacterized protein YndB with AHSA1/START domain
MTGTETIESAAPQTILTIKYATLVRAGRESVFDAFTTAEGLNGWFTHSAVMEARPGGAVRWEWKDWGPNKIAASMDGRVLEVTRPERKVFESWAPGNPAGKTTANVTFEQRDDGTVVSLSETGYRFAPKSIEAYMEIASGWGEALTLLKFYVEHGLRY